MIEIQVFDGDGVDRRQPYQKLDEEIATWKAMQEMPFRPPTEHEKRIMQKRQRITQNRRSEAMIKDIQADSRRSLREITIWGVVMAIAICSPLFFIVLKYW